MISAMKYLPTLTQYDSNMQLLNNMSAANKSGASSTPSIDGIYSVILQNSQLTNDKSIIKKYFSSETATNQASEQTESSSFATEAKSASEDIKSALTALTNGKAEKTAVSSDKNAVDVKSVSKTATDFSLTVNQTAKTQENGGTQAYAAANAADSGVATGKQTIKIENAGKIYYAEYVVSATDTNKDVQKKIADAINAEKAGVSAKVNVDNKTGKSSVVVESAATGTISNGTAQSGERFSISAAQTNGQSSQGAIDAYGLSSVTREAQNAIYSINGEQKTNKTNDIEANGVKLTLKNTTENANIKITEDGTTQINNVRSLVNGVNALLDVTSKNANQQGASSVYGKLFSTLNSNSSELEGIGINITQNGFLEIDEKKMQQAQESGAISKVFPKGATNGSYGLAGKLNQIASTTSSSAADFASGSVSSYLPSSNYFQDSGLSFFADYFM
ncbi:MAG: hypothetical protein LBM16_05825 [Clostridiales bacterium]|jgi:flagellar hook-associated protein 2|nr:hypothetical protein [Clostridiales bacterium]